MKNLDFKNSLIATFSLFIFLTCSKLNQETKTDKSSCDRSFAAIQLFPPQVNRDQNSDLALYAACINDSK
jgi:hypothetical protein